MRGFQIYQPLVAAGLVLVMINVATIFPFWPGNVGLVQVAVAVSLASTASTTRAASRSGCRSRP